MLIAIITHALPLFSCSRGSNHTPSSPGSRCDGPFNYLIQITCHGRAWSVRLHLLIICRAPVHTFARTFRGCNCLSVASFLFHSHFLSVPMSFICTFLSPITPLLSHTPSNFDFVFDITCICSRLTMSLHGVAAASYCSPLLISSICF